MSDRKNLELLNNGKVPEDIQMLKHITTGIDDLTGFLDKHYLKEYIPAGGSKIKFVSGRSGSGKTHMAQLMLDRAKEEGFVTVSFTANSIPLYDFREIYLEILRQCNLRQILNGCAMQIVRELGFEPEKIPEGGNFMDLLSEMHEADAISKGSIRTILRNWFSKNPLLDNFFAGCCSLIVGGELGYPYLEEANREMILSFMLGSKDVRLPQMRALGLSPSRITKYNARHLLRSLSEVIRLSGRKGLLVVIDDLENLLNRTSTETVKYTKQRREDTYESIRQLIDDIDSMRYVMFMLFFDRELMDSENFGLKSYQALWMRIQNEVVGAKFNRFADILDLDRFADQVYDAGTLIKMSEKICSLLKPAGFDVHNLNQEQAEELIRRSEYGGLGLPYMVIKGIHFEEDELAQKEDDTNV